MKLKKLRVVAAVAATGLLTTMAPFATTALAATEPSFPSTSDGPIYLMDNGTGRTVVAGTQLDWDFSNGLVATRIPVTSDADLVDLDATRLPAPTAGETEAIAFISPVGGEKTRANWKSYGDATQVDANGLLLGAIWPAHLGYGAPAAVKSAGGDYSMGWAYLKAGINPLSAPVTKAYYTTINVDAGTGTWKFATPAGAAKTATTTSLSAPASATVGDSVTLTATVSPAGATGTVTFKDGSTTLGTGTLSGGAATFSTTALTAGSHSITANYGGDATYDVSASSASAITVKTNTSLVLSAAATSVEAGTDVVLTAAVTPATATGNVEFFEGSTSLGTGAVASGSATKTVNQGGAGSHTYTAKFVANTSYNASTSNDVTVAWTEASVPVVPKAPSENALVDGNANGLTAAIDSHDVITVSNIPSADAGTTVNVFGYSATPMFLGQVTISGTSLTVNGSGLAAGNHKVAIVTTDGTVLGWATFTKTTAAGNSFSKPINAVVQTQNPADGEFSLKDLSGTASIELTNPVQTANGALSSAKLGKLLVTDLRQVSKPGWDLTTTVGTFTRQGGSDTIANSALGIAPSLVKQAGTGATAPTLGSAMSAGSGYYPYTFATVAGGGWSGQSTYDADLSFLAPSSAPAGTYSSTLTMTLVSK